MKQLHYTVSKGISFDNAVYTATQSHNNTIAELLFENDKQDEFKLPDGVES